MADARNALVRSCRLLIASLVCVALAASAVPAARSANGAAGPAGSAPAAKRRAIHRFTPVERCFMRKIDRRRAHDDLPRLGRDGHLGRVARRHARRMAHRGVIWHDHRLPHRLPNWRRLGQNVGAGATCGALFAAFWSSPGHRANILGRWRFMGVGARRRSGRLFVHQIFRSRRR